MAIFLERFKTKLKQFPLISKSDLDHLLKENQKNLIRLQRLKTYNQDDTGELQDVMAYQKIFQALLNSFHVHGSVTQNIHPLLANIVLEDKHAQAILINDWANYLVDSLKKELYPLKALKNLLENTSTPLQQAAFLLSFLRRGISSKEILESGMLHRFFESNCDNLEQVAETYTLLALGVQPEEPHALEIEQLIKQTAQIRPFAKASAFDHYTLDGSQNVHGVIHPTLNLVFAVTPDFTNLKHLHELFGFDFIIQIISDEAMRRNPVIKQFLVELLNQKLSQEDLTLLYRNILNQTANAVRIPILQQLGSLLYINTQVSLIKSNAVPFIILLAANPQLESQFDNPLILKHLEQPLEKNYIPYGMLLLQDNTFSFYHDIIIKSLLSTLLKQNLNSFSNLLDDDEQQTEYDALRQYPIVTEECNRVVTHLLDELKECINDNMKKITSENEASTGYAAVQDVFYMHLSKVNFLKRISLSNITYPTTIYAFQALLIEMLYNQLTQELNLVQYLDLMHSTQPAKLQTLFECLSVTNNIALQEKIIHTLENDYQIENWMWYEISGISFIERVILNNNENLLINYFPPSLTVEQKLALLGKISHKIVKTSQVKVRFNPLLSQYGLTQETTNAHIELIFFVVNKGKLPALTTLLHLYPEDIRQLLMESHVTHRHLPTPFLYHIAQRNLEALITILGTFSKPVLTKWLSITYIDNRQQSSILSSIFESLTSVNFKDIENILKLISVYPHDLQKEILKQAIYEGGSPNMLSRAIPFPHLFEKLLLIYDNNVYTDLIEANSDLIEANFLSLTRNIPSAIALILKDLTNEELAKAIYQIIENYEFTSVINSAEENSLLLKVLFDKAPPSIHLEMVGYKNKNQKNLLHIAASNPLSLNILLAVVGDEAHTFINQLDSTENLPLFYAAQSLEATETILAVYPNQSDRVKAIKHKDRYEKTVLFNANLEVFHTLLLNYPENERLDAVLASSRDFNKKNVLQDFIYNNKLNHLLRLITLLNPQEKFRMVKMMIQPHEKELHPYLFPGFIKILALLKDDEIYNIISNKYFLNELCDDANFEDNIKEILGLLSDENQFNLAKNHLNFFSSGFLFTQLKKILEKKSIQMNIDAPPPNQTGLFQSSVTSFNYKDKTFPELQAILIHLTEVEDIRRSSDLVADVPNKLPRLK